MNLQAIYHLGKSNYAYAYSKDCIHIRIRTGKDDIDEVTLFYGNKYNWQNKQSMPMDKILSDDLFDYYEIELHCEDSRLGYYFGLKKGEEELFYTEAGFVENFNDALGYCYFFQYPYINELDVHKEPEWIHDAIFYQIFVERFYNGDPENSPSPLRDWEDEPTPKSFYGGDLRGIIEKLDYLEELGVNGIYLTPVFESISNHKYDIIDYMEIDHFFGDKDTFRELVEKAHSKGIKIVLDAVFNHCSERCLQFQDVVEKGKESRFYDWFFIDGDQPEKEPLNYKCFGYVKYMPKLNTANPEVKKYLLDITYYWSHFFEIDGWRLDVSDEIDHQFWRDFRQVVKGVNKDMIIIGENWHNAEPWLRGDQFDSVMNYSVTKLSLDYFARRQINAKQFSEQLATVWMRYPKQVNEAMLNLLDSHDTERFLTSCNNRIESLKLAAAFIFGYMGMPCTYYGTEVGMDGVYDPGCRKGFPWNREKWNMELFEFYKKLIQLRRVELPLKKGDIRFRSSDDLFIMSRTYGEECIEVVINNTERVQYYSLLKNSDTDSYKLVQELLEDDASQCADEKGSEYKIGAMSVSYFKYFII